jgi:hypothetical protein
MVTVRKGYLCISEFVVATIKRAPALAGIGGTLAFSPPGGQDAGDPKVLIAMI